MCRGTLRWLRLLLLLLWRRRTVVAKAWRTLWRRRGRWRSLSISSPWTSAWWLLTLTLWGALLRPTGTTRTSLLVWRTLGLPSRLKVWSLHSLLLWRTHGWVALLLRRSLAHVEWMRSIRVLSRLHLSWQHLREAHLLGLSMPLHRLHLRMMHPLLLSIYQLLLRWC